MAFNLAKLFAKYAKRFEAELLGNIVARKSITGARYPKLSPATLKGDKGRDPNSRLNKTGNFAQNAIRATVVNGGIRIAANVGNAPGGIRYSDILSYNDGGFADFNRKIKQPVPRIFPTTAELFAKLKTTPDFMTDMSKELDIQTQAMLQAGFKPITIELGKK